MDAADTPRIVVRELAHKLADISLNAVQRQAGEFLSTRFSVLRHVRDTMSKRQDA